MLIKYVRLYIQLHGAQFMAVYVQQTYLQNWLYAQDILVSIFDDVLS